MAKGSIAERVRGSMLEGRVVIADCGCWQIWGYSKPPILLRFSACSECIALGLDRATEMLYLDKVDSVSASEEEEDQLWLT